MPITIITGAGETPKMSNGAAGRATPQPPAVEVVEAEADQDDGGRREHHADEVDLDLRAAVVGLSLKLSRKHDGRHARSGCRTPAASR